MKVQATQKKRQPVAMAIAMRLVATGMVLVLLTFAIVSAVSATRPCGGHLFPNLKIGFNIRW